jgi:hypothetical protein
MSIDQSYEHVLNDWQAHRQRCANELKMLDGMIGNLRQFISAQPATAVSSHTTDSVSTGQKYTGMSVRWAILYLLAEHTTSPTGRAEIAKALREGGITSNAQDFASNVSAVLSTMVNERREVEQVQDSGYQITQHGREVWAGIKRTPQWSSRVVTPIAS